MNQMVKRYKMVALLCASSVWVININRSGHLVILLDFLSVQSGLVLLPLFKVYHIRILAFGLGYQKESNDGAQDIASKENPQYIRKTDDVVATEVIE